MSEESQILSELGIPYVDGGFATIVADPPWSFSDKGSRIAPDWDKDTIYNTMSAKDIVSLPVDLLAADKSHLYLWTTDSHLQLAMNCMEAWGFTYKKVLVWVKRRCVSVSVTGDIFYDILEEGEHHVVRGPQQIGMGHWFRSAKELCLFGVRGKLAGNAKNLTDVIEYPRTQHSRKPDTLLEWAELMSPGPRIELFARRTRSGWNSWGDQLPGPDAYLRLVAKSNEFRKARRLVGKMKLYKRCKKAMNADDLVEGLSKWSCRCNICDNLIASGDLMKYNEDGIKICCNCFIKPEEILPF